MFQVAFDPPQLDGQNDTRARRRWNVKKFFVVFISEGNFIIYSSAFLLSSKSLLRLWKILIGRISPGMLLSLSLARSFSLFLSFFASLLYSLDDWPLALCVCYVRMYVLNS